MSEVSVREQLIGKVWPVLDQGFIELRAVMGSDSEICADARVTTGAQSKGDAADRHLIRRMMRLNEMSPFEQAHVKLRIRLPMHVARQLLRYRSAHVQEYSTRYAEAIDAMQATPPDGWRKQAEDNRQGSGGFLPTHDTESMLTIGTWLSARERDLHAEARAAYEDRLRRGVAREQARKDLPLSTYTEIIFTVDLRNLLHLLAERLAPAAQHEIRELAEVIAREIVATLFPSTWAAFSDYRLFALTLSALDIEAIRKAVKGVPEDFVLDHIENKRERAECEEKLMKLGLLTEGHA